MARARFYCLTTCEHCPAVGRQDSRQAFEQCRLAGAVRTDQPQHLACAHVKADIRQRGDAAESFGEILDFKQHLFHQNSRTSETDPLHAD